MAHMEVYMEIVPSSGMKWQTISCFFFVEYVCANSLQILRMHDIFGNAYHQNGPVVNKDALARFHDKMARNAPQLST